MSGSIGTLEAGSDFLGIVNDVAWGAASLVSGDNIGGPGCGIGFVSVNEGSFASTVDEPGGILAITTDTGDNDNAVLVSGPFKAADGGMTLEARFKYNNLDVAVYCGFTETLSLTTPVMPAEFATATMTYNGTGGMVGIQYDVDGTTDDWRAVYADGGAGLSGSSTTGVRANATVTVDRWVTARIVVYPDTAAEVWLSDVGHLNGESYPILRLIKKFAAGLTATDLLYAVLIVENRSANARILEVDYFNATGGRDWKCD